MHAEATKLNPACILLLIIIPAQITAFFVVICAYIPAPVHRYGDGKLDICWKLNERDFEKIMFSIIQSEQC